MTSIKYEGNNNTIDLVNTPNLKMTGYDGLEQPTSETITTSNPYLRGTKYQRSQIADRIISFTFLLYNPESTRQKLMNVFKSGEKGILTLKNDYREGQIECYLEEMAFGRFENPTTCTIFLRAPYPYFKGMEDILAELDNVLDMFELEVYIDEEEGIVLGELTEEHTDVFVNDSDIPLGLTFEITATDTVVNPIIYNETTNKFIGLNITLYKGNKLVITTGVGNKKVYVENLGIQTNVINKLTKNSSFFQLERGENQIKCEAQTGGENMIVYVRYKNEYGAI